MAIKKSNVGIRSGSGDLAAIRELALPQGPKAFDRLVELLASKDERLVLAVAQEILNRAYGKADSGRENREEENGPTVVVIRGEEGLKSIKMAKTPEKNLIQRLKKSAVKDSHAASARVSSKRSRLTPEMA